MRYLDAADLARLVEDGEYCQLVEEAFRDYGRERQVASQPSIATLVAPQEPAAPMQMKGAVCARLGVHGVFFGVRGRDCYLAVCDLRSGLLLGLVEQSRSYKKRTAASAVVVASLLASGDARQAAVIGSGAIAAEVVRQLQARFRLDAIRVASRSMAGAQGLAERLQPETGCPLLPAASVAEAVGEADIVITITSANEPFLHAGMLKRGSLLCSLGGGHEVDLSVLQEVDRLLVDDFGYAAWRGDFRGWIDGGDITRAALAQRIAGDVGQLALGQLPPRQAGEAVMAVIQGMAISDLVIAHAALERARDAGLGSHVANALQVAASPG